MFLSPDHIKLILRVYFSCTKVHTSSFVPCGDKLIKNYFKLSRRRYREHERSLLRYPGISPRTLDSTTSLCSLTVPVSSVHL